MELIRNPFADEQFWSFIIRTFVLLGFGLVIMSLTQITNLRAMFKSLAFKKFASWLIILPALLLIIHSGRIPMLIFVAFMIWTASVEAMNMLRIRPFFRQIFFVHIFITLVTMTFFPDNIILLPVYYLLATFFAAGIRNRTHHVVDQVSFLIIGNLWIGFALALLIPFVEHEQGTTLLTVIFGSVVLSDVFAYLFGGFGKKLGIGKGAFASNISPNKVIAGAVGSVVGAGICMVAYGSELNLGWILSSVLVLLAGLGAAYGDLAESIIKRHAGVKDSGTLIPFHGGMMDRIDSLLFVVPIFYLFFHLFWRSPFFG